MEKLRKGKGDDRSNWTMGGDHCCLEITMQGRSQGKVGTFSNEKGYGFIFISFTNRLFFHFSNWKSDIEPIIGQVVEFDTAPGKKVGTLQAINVRVIADEKGISIDGGAL
jgi:cold shock CspA family protein